MVVDGGAIGVGNLHTVEYNGLLLRAIEFEEPVIGRARQYILDYLPGFVRGNNIIVCYFYDTFIVSAYRCGAGCVEGDGDGFSKRCVFDIIIIVFIHGQRLRKRSLIDIYVKCGNVSIGGNLVKDIFGGCSRCRIVIT